MPLGKVLREFTAKAMSVKQTDLGGGRVQIEVNLSGESTGQGSGQVLGTLIIDATGLTYAATETERIVRGNIEGTVKLGGETNPALGTLIARGAPGAKSGTCSWVGSVYLKNGDEIPSTGEGTWEKTGAHKWRVRSFLYRSDGITRVTEGEVDLATRSYTGTNYEWN